MGVDLRQLVTANRVRLDDLAGRTIAIDAYNALYQFLSIIRGKRGEPLMDRHGRVTSHLSGLLYRTSNLVGRGIRVIYIFDGRPPALKEVEIKRRMEARTEALVRYEEARRRGDVEEARRYAQRAAVLKDYMAKDAKRLLSLMGVPWVQAPSEGEAQAAYMVSRGDAWAAGSQDFDALLFGADRLVRNLSITGRRKLPRKKLYVKIMPEVIEMSRVLSELGITREQLVDVGILVGTDFNPTGVRGIGPKTALKLIRKYGSLEDLLPHLKDARFPVPPARIREVFLRPKVLTDYTVRWRRPLVDEIVGFLCEERDFSEERVRKAIGKMERGMEAMVSTLESFMS
ncbi:TPA: flap endonuclease-1 [Candidatus Bathyarchaeota archaeon]|nr:flap endonuclease-1 [Candidatus Bathyarchaeota archaeon]